jgi:hypothetical protein
MAGNGERAGLATLVALVPSGQLMVQGDGERLTDAVQERLRLLTGARLQGGTAWRAWWRAVRGNIRWDRSSQRYRWHRRSSQRSAAATPRPRATWSPVAHAAAGAVTIPIKVQLLWGPGVTSAQKAAIERNIRKAVDALNGDGRTGRCKPIVFSLDLVVGGALQVDHYSILVNQIPTRNKARWSTSWINTSTSDGRLWTSTAADTELGPLVIEHEFGHIAGLPDEYYEYTSGGQTFTSPIDPASIMGGRDGTLLQRHLDYLSRLHDPAGAAGCEKWVLRFSPWTSQLDAWTDESGGGAVNYLGLTATALLRGYFWVGADGVLLPAGDTPCGSEVVQGRTPSHPNGRATRCPEAGGTSSVRFAHADEGNADCGAPEPNLWFAEDRFDMTVRGTRTGDTFKLRLAVDDEEIAEATHCDPAVEPSITRHYHLLRDGLKYAKALSFSMAPPSSDFRRDGEHKHAFGQATLTRLEPAGG